MASINGVTLKSVKMLRDHEGAPIAQGTVYYNGKKLGTWSQDNWGGCDHYDFDENILADVVDALKASDIVPEEYREYASTDALMQEVLTVIDDEKAYKRMVKKCYKSFVVYYRSSYGMSHGYFTPKQGEDIKKDGFYTTFLKQTKNPDGKYIRIYESLEDFELTL